MNATRRFPVAEPDISDLEVSYAADAVRSTWISSTGPYLDRVQLMLSEQTSTAHCLAVSNGTVALHLILLGLGIGPGDEVIVPSLTYIASVNAVRYVGATPVFADVEMGTFGLSPSSIEAQINPKTRAIIVVHLYGQPADMDPILEIARRRGLKVIEDAAEAPFSTYKGRPVGSLGDASSFSFFGNKVISSGEGGAVCTSDAELFDRMRIIRNQGMDPNRRYFFPVIGHNFRMTNVSAAILQAQLERKTELLTKRLNVTDCYSSFFEESKYFDLQKRFHWATWTPWLFSLTLKPQYKESRNALLMELAAQGIETRPFFIPVHKMPPYKDFMPQNPEKVLKTSIALSEIGFNLPTSSKMLPSDVRYVASIVEQTIKKIV